MTCSYYRSRFVATLSTKYTSRPNRKLRANEVSADCRWVSVGQLQDSLHRGSVYRRSKHWRRALLRFYVRKGNSCSWWLWEKHLTNQRSISWCKSMASLGFDECWTLLSADNWGQLGRHDPGHCTQPDLGSRRRHDSALAWFPTIRHRVVGWSSCYLHVPHCTRSQLHLYPQSFTVSRFLSCWLEILNITAGTELRGITRITPVNILEVFGDLLSSMDLVVLPMTST